LQTCTKHSQLIMNGLVRTARLLPIFHPALTSVPVLKKSDVPSVTEQPPQGYTWKFYYKDGKEHLKFNEKDYVTEELLNPKMTIDLWEKWRKEGKVDSFNNVKYYKLTPSERSFYDYFLYQDADKIPIYKLHPNDKYTTRVIIFMAVVLTINIIYQLYSLLTPWSKNIYNFDYWVEYHKTHH
ncbi:hypothetical protein T10_4639, partial [Trichinella papuae]